MFLQGFVTWNHVFLFHHNYWWEISQLLLCCGQHGSRFLETQRDNQHQNLFCNEFWVHTLVKHTDTEQRGKNNNAKITSAECYQKQQLHPCFCVGVCLITENELQSYKNTSFFSEKVQAVQGDLTNEPQLLTEILGQIFWLKKWPQKCPQQIYAFSPAWFEQEKLTIVGMKTIAKRRKRIENPYPFWV